MRTDLLRSTPQQRKTLFGMLVAATIVFFWPLLGSLASIRLFDRTIHTTHLTVTIPFAWAALVKGDNIYIWRPCRIAFCYLPPSSVAIERRDEILSSDAWAEGIANFMKFRVYTAPVASTARFGRQQIECWESRSTADPSRVVKICRNENDRLIAAFDGVTADLADFKKIIESGTVGVSN